MTDSDDEAAAKDFLLMGIQEWGQSEDERARATARYLFDAGFEKITASGYPIFGGMFPQKPIEGPDGTEAFEWLNGILNNLKRGRFEDEVQQLTDALPASREKRQAIVSRVL